MRLAKWVLLGVLVPVSALAGSAQDKVVEIRRQIEQASVGPHNLTIEYREGRATLTGDVARPEDRDRIAAIVDSVDGVEQVDNRIEVMARGRMPGQPVRGDQAIRDDVQRIIAEEGAANPEGRSETWSVAEVNAGTVMLRGDMRDRPAVDRLLSKVLMVPGVQNIESNITVRGGDYMDEQYREKIGQ